MDFFADIDNHRYLIGALFILTGTLHFLYPKPYIKIIPSYIPKPESMVFWSGIAEVFGGIGIMKSQFQVIAGCGLIILLLAVFPANWEMFLQSFSKKKHFALTLLFFLRLPIQFWLMYWVFIAAGLSFP